MNIFLNDKALKTTAKSSLEIFNKFKKDESDVLVINGFATKQDLELKENDEIFIIQKGVFPSKKALNSLMRARHTPGVFNALKRARVAILGLGGLGSHLAVMLSRSGIGKLLLIDFDIVEPSNLNRQAYSICDLAKFKTLALKEQLKNINPYTKVKTKNLKIEKKHLKTLFKDIDIVCEAFDNAFYKAMLAQNFHKFYPDTPLICASGLAGYAKSNDIKTHKLAKNFYICGDLVSQAKPGNGLMAPRVMLCAAHQANLVLELLVRKEDE